MEVIAWDLKVCCYLGGRSAETQLSVAELTFAGTEQVFSTKSPYNFHYLTRGEGLAEKRLKQENVFSEQSRLVDFTLTAKSN